MESDPGLIDCCIGRNMRRLRLDAGYSQQKIATLFDITYQQMQKYEKGKSRIPARMLVKLQDFYGVSYDAFLTGLEQGPHNRETAHPSHYDLLTLKICRRLARISDDDLKKKIYRIVTVLAA